MGMLIYENKIHPYPQAQVPLMSSQVLYSDPDFFKQNL